jgi:WD repeat-containing protein 26
MEAPEVSEFRQYILDASWDKAENALMNLGVTDDEGLWVSFLVSEHNFNSDAICQYQEARFLISQQKYLELLEGRQTTTALNVLRNELASNNIDPDQLHSLSRYATVRLNPLF